MNARLTRQRTRPGPSRVLSPLHTLTPPPNLTLCNTSSLLRHSPPSSPVQLISPAGQLPFLSFHSKALSSSSFFTLMATTPRSAPSTMAYLLRSQLLSSRRLRFYIRASRSMDSRNRKDRSDKELGLYSIRRNIEEIVSHVVEVAPAALRLEEERRIEQEEMLHRSNLWDDLDISDESLSALADATKVVESLKDIQKKVRC